VRFAAAATVISCDGAPAGALPREQLSDIVEAKISIRLMNGENECEKLRRENSSRATGFKLEERAITLLLTSVF
jgi:hypothetical protein